MNVKTVMTVVLACGVVALSGCAGMKSKDSTALASSLSDDPANPVDLAYIARVNSQANERGYQILWVNPPGVKPGEKDKAYPTQN
jgi:hypothetical protein